MSDEPTQNSPSYEVTSVGWESHRKKLRFGDERDALWVPLSACVTKGDTVITSADGNIYVECSNGRVQILPPYRASFELALGGELIKPTVKEVTSFEESQRLERLSTYHYRGGEVFGRKARLILSVDDLRYPPIIGYIELASPLFMNRARGRVLDAPFSNGKVEWSCWDSDTIRQYINIIVRISRVVVSPEFRGFGLGKRLVEHAIEFGRERWQVGGFRPYFLEISADMLKYVPFVTDAGMKFVGYTEGNLDRVADDMEYLLGRFRDDPEGQAKFEDVSGICDQQMTRMRETRKLMEQEGISQTEIISELHKAEEQDVVDEYWKYHNIVTLPKPHYMTGLDEDANEFLSGRLEGLDAPPDFEIDVDVEKLSGPIDVTDLSIKYQSSVPRTERTQRIHQAFGISPDSVETDVISELSFEIGPGNIVLIVGPSGSGKTTLLDLLSEDLGDSADIKVAGTVKRPANAVFGRLEPISSSDPVIELIDGYDIRQRLLLLGSAGLAEPALYLKRFTQLSGGQQYRVMLARMLASESNVWLADEFCSNLDSATANVVAAKIGNLARRSGATAVFASSRYRSFIQALDPDFTLLLRSAASQKLLVGNDYETLIEDDNRRSS